MSVSLAYRFLEFAVPGMDGRRQTLLYYLPQRERQFPKNGIFSSRRRDDAYLAVYARFKGEQGRAKDDFCYYRKRTGQGISAFLSAR
jgi:hypothetical protein